MATLIGIKTFTNEFIAYTRLANLTTNRAIIEGWELQGPNHTKTFMETKNCFRLVNSTFTDDCVEGISVSTHDYRIGTGIQYS